MKNNVFKVIAILLVVFFVLYEFKLIRFPVTCSQIIEPFDVIPKKVNSQDAFLDWINQHYTWRKNEKISINPDYDSPTSRVLWENGNKVYLAHLENETFKLVALQVVYDYNGGLAPYIDDVIFRNSQQPRFSKAIECFGYPEYYVAATTGKHNIVTLWYPDKGMVIYGSANKNNDNVEKFDIDTIAFLSEPTTPENMIKIFNQLTLLDFSRDAKFITSWSSFDSIDFVAVAHP